MNRDCGKPHEFVRKLPKKKRDKILSDITKYMMINSNTGEPAWAQKNGSIDEEVYSPSQRRYDERMANRNWLQKLFNL